MAPCPPGSRVEALTLCDSRGGGASGRRLGLDEVGRVGPLMGLVPLEEEEGPALSSSLPPSPPATSLPSPVRPCLLLEGPQGGGPN